MTQQNAGRFLSQPILAPLGGPPLVARQGKNGSTPHDNNKSKYEPLSSTSSLFEQEIDNSEHNRNSDKETPPRASWGWRMDVSLIPKLPIYYILEPASHMSLQDIPTHAVETRILEFLRLHSISYTFQSHAAADSSTGNSTSPLRLDCCTSTMLKFSIQFWLVAERNIKNNKKQPPATITMLELQRRQGCVIEMQTIRRGLFRAVSTGKQDDTTRSRKVLSSYPDAAMDEVNSHCTTYDPVEGRTEAVHLLESSNIDQIKLGLESLQMLTDPSVVSKEDATIISRDVLFRETELGHRLQASLAMCFGIAAAAATASDRADDEERKEGIMPDYIQGDYLESIHIIGLAILSNALQLVLGDDQECYLERRQDEVAQCLIDGAQGFYKLVADDLVFNLQTATHRPNEGAISAKCIRLLSVLKDKVHTKGIMFSSVTAPNELQFCLKQAYQYGQRCHLSLETEAQQLLAMDIDQALVVR